MYLHSLRIRAEKVAICSPFNLFLKPAQINYIFSGNVDILYIYPVINHYICCTIKVYE